MLPRLHVVTDDRVLATPNFPEIARTVLNAGGQALALHVRGPRTDGATLLATVEVLRPSCDDSGASLFVNDRVDVALVSGLKRVHVGRRSLPVVESRELLGPDSVLGVSCHSPDDVRNAATEGADFAFVGTLYATPSHPDREGAGPGIVREAGSVAGGLPLVGIGGVTPDRVGPVMSAGAHGVAVVRGVWESEDPAVAVEHFLGALGTS